MSAPRFHPFVRLLFCALGLIAVSVLLGAMLVVGAALATPWTGQRPAAQLVDLATRFALPLTVLSYPASLGWIALCRTQFDRCSFVSLGLRSRRAFSDGGRGALVGTLSIGLLWTILWLTGAVSVGGWSPEAFEMGVARSLLTLAGYAALFFAVGFFEETLFRGYLLHNLNAWMGWMGAVALQAIAFAIVHLGNVGSGDSAARLAALGALPSLGLIAVFFALCYRKTGSLWFPIGFHFAWNFCLGCVFSLPVSGIKTFRLLDVSENQNNWLSGGAFGAEGSFFLIPILCALIYYITRAPDHPQAALDLALLSRTETVAAPVIAAPEIEIEAEIEPRENRYGTKFGTSQGFSADTLRELREFQEEREKASEEARDAVRRDALAQLHAPRPAENAALTAASETSLESVAQPAFQPVEVALSRPAELTKEPEVASQGETVTPVVSAPIPEVSKAPETPPAPEKPPVPAPPAKVKPPAPRW